MVKQNLIRAMDLIGRSLHIDHLKKTFVFNKRVDLINHLLVSKQSEGPKVCWCEGAGVLGGGSVTRNARTYSIQTMHLICLICIATKEGHFRAEKRTSLSTGGSFHLFPITEGTL